MGLFSKRRKTSLDNYPNHERYDYCIHCRQEGSVNGIFNSNKIIRGKRLHKKCIDEYNIEKKRKEKVLKDMEIRENERITKRRLNERYEIITSLSNDLETVLSIEYGEGQKAKRRYFFSEKDTETIYSKDFTEFVNNNLITIRISPERKGCNTRWNYEGDKEIGDNFEAGYSATIIFHNSTYQTQTLIMNILRELGFGVFPSEFTILAHKEKLNPSHFEAKQILDNIVENITKETS